MMMGTDCIGTILLCYPDHYIVLTIMVMQFVYMNSIKKIDDIEDHRRNNSFFIYYEKENK